MTFAPATLTALGAYWTANGGINLGVVGDAGHQAKGTSYHLGRSALADGAYSAKTARDRAGLSEAASAIDLGRLGGSLIQLQNFSRWLVDQARHNAAGTSDMREIIYSPDGTKVLRWDRQRGYNSLPKPGEADDSHRSHTHVSWYRDAEGRDHRTAFRPYFEGADDVDVDVTGTDPLLVDIPQGAKVLNLDGSARLTAQAARTGVYSPFTTTSTGGTALRAIVWTAADPKPDLMLAVYAGAIENPRPPAGTVDCTSQVKAEHDKVKGQAVAAAQAIP
jgi:hypothetical protein